MDIDKQDQADHLRAKKALRFRDALKRETLQAISQKLWKYKPHLAGQEVLAVLILIPPDHPAWPRMEREIKEEAAFWEVDFMALYARALEEAKPGIEAISVFFFLETGDYSILHFAPDDKMPKA